MLQIKSSDKIEIKEIESIPGYDGHSLRAFNYWAEDMPDIKEAYDNATTKEERTKIINSIPQKYPDLRQDSKAYTFKKNYGGFIGGDGRIDKNYDKMYEVTHQYKDFIINQATAKGYLDVAFGLRVRTPLIYGKNSKYLFGLEAGEARTAYNADSQSFAALTNRALIDFKQRLLKEPRELQESVLLLNSIYDAIYILMKEDPDVVAWVNTNLVEAMSWQGEGLESPVKISAELEIGKDWYNLTELPHNIKADEIELILPNLSDKSPKGFTL